MKNIKIKNFSMKLWVVLSILAVVNSYDEDSWEGAVGQYEREAYDDDIPIILTLPEIEPTLQVKVFYKNHHLFVTQQKTAHEQPKLDPREEKPDLQIVVPNTETVYLNPSDLNPEKEIHIYHSKEHIFVFQGEVPEIEPELPLISTADDSTLYLNATYFVPEKLIKIYYDGDRLFVSQRDVPDNKYFHDKPVHSFLQYIGSDRAVVYLYPTKINWDEDVAVQHSPHSISVFQGRKPRSYLRKDNAGETEYLPDSVKDFDATFDSGEIYTMYSDDFNPKKVALIFFENGKVRITQLEAPEETNPDLLPGKTNLQTRTSDRNELVLHPAKISPEVQIKVQHTRKRIFVWTGRDRAPSFNVNRPELIEVIRPKEEREFYDVTVDSGEIFRVYSDEFNPEKLVRIFVKNGQLKVTQVGAPEETDPTLLHNVISLQTITRDENSLLFHPARFSSNIKIRILYKDNKIFLWTGRSQPPKFNSNQPEIVEVIEPKTVEVSEFDTSFESGETVELFPDIVKDIKPPRPEPREPKNFDVLSGETLIVSPGTFKVNKLVYVVFKNNKLQVTQDNLPESDLIVEENLPIVKSEDEPLMFHPTLLDLHAKIYMRHQNGTIYIWQGSEDLPDDVVGVEEDQKPVSVDLSKSIKNLTVININKPVKEEDINLTLVKTEDNLIAINISKPAKEEINLTLIEAGNNSSGNVEGDSVVKNGNYTFNSSKIINKQEERLNSSENTITEIVKMNPTMNITLTRFNPKKLVSVSFKNDTWVLNQLDTPDETLNRTLNSTKLQIVKPSTETLFLHTKFIDSAEAHLRYDDGKIYLWQGDSQPLINVETDVVQSVAKPKTERKPSRARIVNVTEPFVQDTGELELPKAENVSLVGRKQQVTYNETIESGRTLQMSSGQFDSRKLVMVSFKNNTLEVTQVRCPKETWSGRNEYKKNLQIIRPDTDVMYFHAGLADLESKVNFRHENGKIYIWQGAKPTVNVESPIVNVIDPNPREVTSENDFDATYESNYTLKEFSRRYNLRKLLAVSVENNKLHVSQVNSPEETAAATGEYKNLQIVKPDTFRVFVHLARVNPDLLIHIRYENGRIYIWQGSDQLPKADVDMSDVVQVIEPTVADDEDDEDGETVVQDINQSVSDRMTLTLFSNMYNPDELVVVKHANHQIYVNQIERVEDDGNKNPGYEELHLSIPNKSSATFDPRKVDPSKMIIINYIKKKIHINTASY